MEWGQFVEGLVEFLVKYRPLHEHPNNEFLSKRVYSQLDPDVSSLIEFISSSSMDRLFFNSVAHLPQIPKLSRSQHNPRSTELLYCAFPIKSSKVNVECINTQDCPPTLKRFFEQAKDLSMLEEPKDCDASVAETYSNSGTNTRLIKGIGPKKMHELVRLTRLIQEECTDSIDRLIDVGCGSGHLCGFLESRPGKKIEVIGVESNTALCGKGRSRYGRGWTVRFENERFKAGDEQLRRKLLGKENEERVALVCLHGCGDLQMELLREFVELNSLDVQTRRKLETKGVPEHLFTVGCCYHKMSLATWPMSRMVKNCLERVGYQFYTPSFRLACQERMIRWREMSDEEHGAHESAFARRALFECLRGEGSGRKAYKRFVKSTSTTTINSGEEIERLIHQHADGLAAIEAYTALQFAMQAPLETIILLDRVLYLQENGLPTRLVPLFKSSISPRNICILARGRGGVKT